MYILKDSTNILICAVFQPLLGGIISDGMIIYIYKVAQEYVVYP